MTEFAINVRHLSKHFGDKVAVDDVSIRMPKGQVWGFLGPNGSGKTTTIRMICGLLRPTHGEGQCLGYKIPDDFDAIKRHTGYMTQRFSFWGDLSIRENLEFVGRMYQLRPLRRIVDETLEILGLTHRQRQLADALSGGWKQRLALAAVTMHQPELLLLDEPTAGVDPQARREFWDQIHRLSDEGMTVLVSTHYMDEAERCDRIVYLAHGKLMVEGTVNEIIGQSGLLTYQITGQGARQWLERLRNQPGVDHAAFYGSALNVSGSDASALQQALAGLPETLKAEPVNTSLEDVFIDLMVRAGEDKRLQ